MTHLEISRNLPACESLISHRRDPLLVTHVNTSHADICELFLETCTADKKYLFDIRVLYCQVGCDTGPCSDDLL